MLSDTDLAAINELPRLTDEMGATGDWAAFENLITEDFEFAVPGRAPILGRPAWREFAEEIGPLPGLKTVFDKVDGAGDLAYVWGHQNFSVEVDGDRQDNTSRFLAILRKNAEGTWQFTTEAVTFDQPFMP